MLSTNDIRAAKFGATNPDGSINEFQFARLLEEKFQTRIRPVLESARDALVQHGGHDDIVEAINVRLV